MIATALAAKRLKCPYAVDLEDFHGAEHSATDAEGAFCNRLAQAAEKIVFRDAAFLTTASDAIADRYARAYGKRPLVINNTFPLPPHEPEFAPVDGADLRLYWFSQTIGAGRGLEDAILAAGWPTSTVSCIYEGIQAAGILTAFRRWQRSGRPS